MALSVLPTQTEPAGITPLIECRDWCGVTDVLWNQASSVGLGTVPSLRVLAATPPDVYRQMLHLLRLPAPRPHAPDPASPLPPPRELSAVEAIQLALMWIVARRLA